MNDSQKIHPIGYVVRQAGLSAHVIRVWEKRYGAVKPGRTGSGRRLYSDADIQHLVLLKKASDSGHRIAQLSELDEKKLREIVAGSLLRAPARAPAGAKPDTAENYLKKCRKAVIDLDGPSFEAALNEAAVFLTRPVLISKLIVPLMVDIGERWARGSLKIVNEHMCSSILRSFLWNMLKAYRPHERAAKIVVATPSGQWHELGALTVAIFAAEAGWAVHYFGPNLPVEEIAAAAGMVRARAVALSVAYHAGESEILGEIKKLRQYLPEAVSLVVGGRGLPATSAGLQRQQVLPVHDLTELRKTLDKLI